MFSWIYACRKGWDRRDAHRPVCLLLTAGPAFYRRGPLWAGSVSGNGIGPRQQQKPVCGPQRKPTTDSGVVRIYVPPFSGASAANVATGVFGVTLAIGK